MGTWICSGQSDAAPNRSMIAWREIRRQLATQGYFHDHQPESDFSTERPVRRRPQDQYLPLAAALCLDVLRAGPRDVDAHPHPPGIMGSDQCRGVVCLDGVRNFGGHRHRPSGEDAADGGAGDLLQSALAYSCGVSTLVKGHVGGITGGKHHLVVLMGDITHRCCALGIRVCELFLQSPSSRTCSLSAAARCGTVAAAAERMIFLPRIVA